MLADQQSRTSMVPVEVMSNCLCLLPRPGFLGLSPISIPTKSHTCTCAIALLICCLCNLTTTKLNYYVNPLMCKAVRTSDLNSIHLPCTITLSCIFLCLQLHNSLSLAWDPLVVCCLLFGFSVKPFRIFSREVLYK